MLRLHFALAASVVIAVAGQAPESGFAFASVSADFVMEKLRKQDNRLLRTFKDGQAKQEGFLDDYAFLVQALLDLFEATSDGSRIAEAIDLQSSLDQHFWDEQAGGNFMTSDAHERLLARDKPTYDGAEPSGNSVALMNLLRLAELTSKDEYRKRAEAALAAFSRDLAGSPGTSRLVPGLDGKRALRDSVTAFVCGRGRCKLPTSKPEVFARQLSQVKPLP